MVRHLRSLADINAKEMDRILELAREVKRRPGLYSTKLAGRSIAVMFSKQSTRTRVSFEVGCYQLGAQPLILTAGGSTGMQMGRGETISDTAHVMSRYVDCIVIRTFEQAEVDGLAQYGSVPVVNALTDDHHPCQALADVQTMRERFDSTKGLKVVYAGAGNNVTHSLMQAGPRAGYDMVVACPPDLKPNPKITEQVMAECKAAGTKLTIEHDLKAAVKGAHVVYTDTWVSMGQDKEAEALKAKLRHFSVTGDVMRAAAPNAIFMHCLPAHRGEEVTDEVIDGPWSVVFDEAENRLHAQKALLLLLMNAEPWNV